MKETKRIAFLIASVAIISGCTGFVPASAPCRSCRTSTALNDIRGLNDCFNSANDNSEGEKRVEELSDAVLNFDIGPAPTKKSINPAPTETNISHDPWQKAAEMQRKYYEHEDDERGETISMDFNIGPSPAETEKGNQPRQQPAAMQKNYEHEDDKQNQTISMTHEEYMGFYKERQRPQMPLL
mmetsp:Transcript_33056/g.56176  ORF Transcript_33056/g.56176 Transcript_33056/m.56176 type:complete len:183 (-) Transcript_33056:93-641(-)|eukprot:CAMPEP_0183704162 /NCGR_PEP_ID=MMETSP0737-20130205/1595_1 /TAXON_ID=385413 /ORGANISM="Thalassiosira miniscula, Strain CCMP1093" /LENGTH=182 /DNA_ID=CAMNT_0025930983 /DNA_START=103 /DNA_END=651 /DNA_ORIENTATION=-